MGVKYIPIQTITELVDGRFYRLADLQALLKNLSLNFSIFIIRDYETWKCIDYKCGKRHNTEVSECADCSGTVRPPLIASPRSRGGGRGVGHRRYTANEIKKIIATFRLRR